MSTPEIYLQTSFIVDGAGFIVSTREPSPTRGPLFTLVRSTTQSAWLMRAGLERELARELEGFARREPPAIELRAEPVHSAHYRALLADRIGSGEQTASKGASNEPARHFSGLAYSFPSDLGVAGGAVGGGVVADGVVAVTDEGLLERHFEGWKPGEIAAGRAPLLAAFEAGSPVSICFCARRTETAAEAGLETAKGFRRRGLAARVTRAWALALRESGRTPLYSTAWTNTASQAVASALGLTPYASIWSLSD